MPPLNLSAYLLIFNALVIGGWAFDHQHQKNKYLTLQNDYQQLAINAEIHANEIESKWRKTVEESQHAFVEREKRLQADLANSAAANVGLRGTIENLKRSLPTNTNETNRAYADALTIVFSECATKLAELGQAADRHANEAATLSEAWPAQKPN